MHLIYYVLVSCNIIIHINTVTANIFVSCGESDSCGGRNQSYPRVWSQEFYKRNCFCDNWCAEYGDCCYDAPFSNVKLHRSNNFPYQCMETFRIGRIYVKSLCYNNWPNDYIKWSCEHSPPDDEHDMLKLVPVLDVTSRITYKNVFCAVCNNAIPRYLKSWDMVIACPLNDVFVLDESKREIEKILQKIQFNFITNKWEVLINRSAENSFLLQCTQKGVRISQELLEDPSKFRSCKNVISSCHSFWQRTSIANSCERERTLYRYVISPAGTEIQTYKNIYCAMCNFVNMSSLTCFDNGLYAPVQSPIPDVILFSLRFKTNDAENAFNRKCPAGQIYDEWSKHCEYITCNAKLSQTRGICNLKAFWYKLKMRDRKIKMKNIRNL